MNNDTDTKKAPDISEQPTDPINTDTTGGDETKTEGNDPYAYLNRDEFTSEKFKIEVKDLPKFYGISVNNRKKYSIISITNICF